MPGSTDCPAYYLDHLGGDREYRSAVYWRSKAGEARSTAAVLCGPEARQTMERIAASYDLLAEHYAESNG
jgi:hypothetical protein